MSADPHGELRFVLAALQRRTILYRPLLVALPALLALLLAGRVSGWPLAASLSPAAGFVVLLVVVYLMFARNYAVLDQAGIRSRWHLLRARTIGWDQIARLQLENVANRNGASRYIKVWPVSGKPFHLGAPLDTAGMRDPEFASKAGQILSYDEHLDIRPAGASKRRGTGQHPPSFRHHGQS